MEDLNDAKGFSSYKVVTSFTIGGYTFFLGNAQKIDIPYALTRPRKRKYRNDLRMSRVCNSDSTRDFESRIDIALSCDPSGNFNILLNLIYLFL